LSELECELSIEQQENTQIEKFDYRAFFGYDVRPVTEDVATIRAQGRTDRRNSATKAT